MEPVRPGVPAASVTEPVIFGIPLVLIGVPRVDETFPSVLIPVLASCVAPCVPRLRRFWNWGLSVVLWL